MSDNRSARIVNGIPETQSLDFSRRVTLWTGALTLTSQSISIPWSKIVGIDKLELFFQQMGSDAKNGYTGGADLLVGNITTALKENILPLSGLDFSSGKYLACGRYSYQRSGDNLVIKWVNKGWFDVPSMAWNDARTMDNGLSLVRIEGYQSFNLVDTYLKSEIDTMIPKIGIIRLDGTSVYLKADSRDFPAGTVVIMNHYYVGGGSGSESSLAFTRNTTNTTAATVIGGITAGRWQANISGSITLTNLLPKGSEILLGTVNITQSGTTNAVARSIAYGGM